MFILGIVEALSAKLLTEPSCSRISALCSARANRLCSRLHPKKDRASSAAAPDVAAPQTSAAPAPQQEAGESFSKTCDVGAGRATPDPARQSGRHEQSRASKQGEPACARLGHKTGHQPPQTGVVVLQWAPADLKVFIEAGMATKGCW